VLQKARRVNLSFEVRGDSLDGMSLVIDTEAIRYKWKGADGSFPDYEKLIPNEFTAIAHLDTVEAGKAISSLKALADNKSYPVDLTLDNGCMVMTSPDDKGQVTIPADTEGSIRVRIDGGYLTEALRACGGMVDLKLANGHSPMLFTVDGYRLVVMPMLTTEAPAQAEAQAEPIAQAETEPEDVQAVAEAEAITKAEKPKRSRKRDKVAVA